MEIRDISDNGIKFLIKEEGMMSSPELNKSGVYKITSPAGNIYIGQSICLRARLSEYKYLKCKNQKLIYESILEYGLRNHLFEVLEFCEVDTLHSREAYYVNLFRSNKNRYPDGFGLNLTDGGKGSNGYKHRDDVRVRMGAIRKLQVQTPEANAKRSAKLKGRIFSEETKLKLRVPKTKEHVSKIVAAHMIPVIDESTGNRYGSIKEAAQALGYNNSTLKGWLNGRYENKSTLRYA